MCYERRTVGIFDTVLRVDVNAALSNFIVVESVYFEVDFL